MAPRSLVPLLDRPYQAQGLLLYLNTSTSSAFGECNCNLIIPLMLLILHRPRVFMVDVTCFRQDSWSESPIRPLHLRALSAVVLE